MRHFPVFTLHSKDGHCQGLEKYYKMCRYGGGKRHVIVQSFQFCPSFNFMLLIMAVRLPFQTQASFARSETLLGTNKRHSLTCALFNLSI